MHVHGALCYTAVNANLLRRLTIIIVFMDTLDSTIVPLVFSFHARILHLLRMRNKWMFVKGLQRCCGESLQHGNAHLANSVVDNFCR